MCPPLHGERMGIQKRRAARGASLSPKGPREDQRDSGASATAWGMKGSTIIPDPHTGNPIPRRSKEDRGDSGASAAVWGKAVNPNASDPPTGPSLSPKQPTQGRRDSGVSAAVWGTWKGLAYPTPSRGTPIPQSVQAGPEGLGCIRRCAGRYWSAVL